MGELHPGKMRQECGWWVMGDGPSSLQWQSGDLAQSARSRTGHLRVQHYCCKSKLMELQKPKRGKRHPPRFLRPRKWLHGYLDPTGPALGSWNIGQLEARPLKCVCPGPAPRGNSETPVGAECCSPVALRPIHQGTPEEPADLTTRSTTLP